jgi:high-affinity Fe2+/Pb2+ permease
VLFVAGSATDEGGALAPGVLGAGTVGLLAGVALGWLVYAGLSRIPVRHLFSSIFS